MLGLVTMLLVEAISMQRLKISQLCPILAGTLMIINVNLEVETLRIIMIYLR